MSRHETYYQQRPVPCPCGGSGAYWHGPEHGLRGYYCDVCWDRRECLRVLKGLVSTFDPNRQAMYEFARTQIEQARKVIEQVEGNL